MSKAAPRNTNSEVNRENISSVQEWFEENFKNDAGYTMFNNAINYVAKSSFTKKQGANILRALLGGTGVSDSEIKWIVDTICSDD